MGGLQLTLAVLALAATVKGQSPPCWYEDVCGFDQNGDTNSEINTVDHATLEDQLVFCQDLCFNEATCKYFTVWNTGGARNKVYCYQLAACDHEEGECIGAGTCGSGPGDCTQNTNCPVLDALTMADDETIRWHCDNIDPYTEEIPEGTTCSLDCQAWEDEDGKSSSIQSTCQGADPTQKWTDSEAVGAGGEDVIYPTLAVAPADRPRPDSPAVDQRKCGCPPFPMAWALEDGTSVNYDPNTLPGTDFVCSDDYLVANAVGDIVFELREGNKCRLFCDGYHIATMECNGKGKWTGEPELGAWCYYEPTADDQLGVTTTTATTTTTIVP